MSYTMLNGVVFSDSPPLHWSFYFGMRDQIMMNMN